MIHVAFSVDGTVAHLNEGGIFAFSVIPVRIFHGPSFASCGAWTRLFGRKADVAVLNGRPDKRGTASYGKMRYRLVNRTF